MFFVKSGKWGVFFFVKKSEKWGGGCKKVNLFTTQGALCTVSVFFILHFTFLGVRTRPTHPTCLRHTFVVYTGDSALVENKRKPSITECCRRRVPQLHVARPRTRLIRTAQSRVPRESRLGMRHAHTHAPFVGTPRVSRYQKGKTNPDVTEARESE